MKTQHRNNNYSKIPNIIKTIEIIRGKAWLLRFISARNWTLIYVWECLLQTVFWFEELFYKIPKFLNFNHFLAYVKWILKVKFQEACYLNYFKNKRFMQNYDTSIHSGNFRNNIYKTYRTPLLLFCLSWIIFKLPTLFTKSLRERLYCCRLVVFKLSEIIRKLNLNIKTKHTN